jgi:hypothetical protein
MSIESNIDKKRSEPQRGDTKLGLRSLSPRWGSGRSWGGRFSIDMALLWSWARNGRDPR